MTTLLDAYYWGSAAFLLLTKACDVYTTWKFIGATGETNPLARWLFARLGLLPSLLLVFALTAAIVAVTYLPTATEPAWLKATVATVGLAVGLVQADVARFNATGTSSPIIRAASAGMTRLARLR